MNSDENDFGARNTSQESPPPVSYHEVKSYLSSEPPPMRQIRSFVMAAFGAAMGVTVNLTTEFWVLLTVAAVSLAAGWMTFVRIWSNHGDDADALREIWKTERWLWLVLLLSFLLYWLRFGN